MRLIKLAIIIPGVAFYVKRIMDVFYSTKRSRIKHGKANFNETVYVADDVK